jgi:RNA polymerase sigma-70 factor (ECF subfamily)
LIEERRLLRRARRWESDALAEIYDRYSPEIYRYVMRQLGVRYLAEECVGETFHRFLRAIRRGSGPDRHLRAYLYRIAHNWVVDHVRAEPPLQLEEEVQAARGSEPVHVMAEQGELEEIRAALSHLTSDQRQVVVLRYVEGWSHKEIARSMKKSSGAVKALQHRALAALRRRLVAQQE